MASVANSGGQPGNTNAVTHGLHAFRASGKIPLSLKGCKYLRGVVRAMRWELVEEVGRMHGREPSLYEDALIQSSTRHEGRARLLEHWFAEEADKLSLADRLAILKAIGDASDARDKAIKALGLDRCEQVDPFAAIYRAPAPASDTEPGAGAG